MTKHIIDTESSDFDGIPMETRKSHKGRVLLKHDLFPDGSSGIITIGLEDLTEVITDDTGGVSFPLTIQDPDELEVKARTVRKARRFAGIPAQYHGKIYEEYLAGDVETNNNSGHRRYAKIHEELMDDESVKTLLQASGISLSEIAQMKTKFQNAQKAV